MDSITPIILTNSLNINRGGLTIAIFTRANTLIKKYDEVYIYTLIYQRNHNEIIENIYDSGLLDRRVKVINLFEDMRTYNNIENTANTLVNFLDEKELEKFKDLKVKYNAYRYYQNGIYKMYKRYDDNENLVFIDYMDDSRHRIERHEFNPNGNLVKISHMDKFLNKPRLDRYIDNQGNCYLTIWVNPKNLYESRFTTFGKEPKEYDSIKDGRKNWIEEKIQKFDNPILISDRRDIDNIILDIKHINIKRVAVFHNNHLKPPYNNNILEKVKDNPRDNYKNSLNNIKKMNRIVLLTNEQKNDIESLFGKNKTFCVIPHAAKNSIEKKTKEYNQYTAVTLARLSDQKALHEAIKAFKLVVDKIPKAKYYIYGSGKEKENLNQLIKELNLENNIKLKKYTNNPSKVYQSAACSLLTSNFEGFGMVITESMANGTPVISYDTKYGPNDIIENNKNGFLIPKGNREEFAKKIIKLMKSKRLRNKLSKNTLKVTDHFSESDYINNWNDLLKNVANEH